MCALGALHSILLALCHMDGGGISLELWSADARVCLRLVLYTSVCLVTGRVGSSVPGMPNHTDVQSLPRQGHVELRSTLKLKLDPDPQRRVSKLFLRRVFCHYFCRTGLNRVRRTLSFSQEFPRKTVQTQFLACLPVRTLRLT